MLHGTKIELGHLDRWIQVYKRASVETDYGFEEQDVLVEETWAQEMPKTRTMREEIMGGKESSIQEVHWRVRKETEVYTDYWIKYEDYYYDVITILPEGRDYRIIVTQLRHNAQYSGVSS